MAEPIHNPNHLEEAVASLVSRFKGEQGELEPRYKAIVEAVMAEVQLLEDAFWSLIYDRLLSTASGAALNQVGALVGEERLSPDDAEYRRFIAARISVNASGGEIDRLIWILETLTGATYVQLMQVFPAALVLDYQVPVYPTEAEFREHLGELMEAAVVAGVNLHLVEGPHLIPLATEGYPGGGGLDEGIFADVAFTTQPL